MTKTSSPTWKEYHLRTSERPAREHLRRAVNFVHTNNVAQRTAIDLGYGAGVESLFLLASGFDVYAVDSSRSAAQMLRAKIPAEKVDKVKIRISRVERAKLPPADLVWAGLCLPFTESANFPSLWTQILSALKPGGVFVGDFFGRRHAWANSSAKLCHNQGEVRKLVRPLDLLSLTIERGVRLSAVGQLLFYNEMFTVIARKRINDANDA